MILTVLIIIVLFLWLLALLASPRPTPPAPWFPYAVDWLAFFAVLILFLLFHGVRV